MNTNFQRKGATSNTQVGNDFEDQARVFFTRQGLNLSRGFEIAIGINSRKPHKFDLGDKAEKIIIECKSHTWTNTDNTPSAKLTTWNEAMFYFYVTPPGYKKILFILRDYSEKRRETLGQYYIRTYSHLIPNDVEIWEYDGVRDAAIKLK